MDIAASIERLTILKGSPFHNFCHAAAQSCVPTVTRLLGKLRCGKGINCPSPSAFMLKVLFLVR
eukprot:7651775-Lingulodinium_polyedra.AAC.1